MATTSPNQPIKREKVSKPTKSGVSSKPKPLKTGPSATQEAIPTSATKEIDALRSLVAPHVDSFNNFVQNDLPRAVRSMKVLELSLGSYIHALNKRKAAQSGNVGQKGSEEEIIEGKEDENEGPDGKDGSRGRENEPTASEQGDELTISIWFEKITIGMPRKDGFGRSDGKMFPSECRQAGISYAAPMTAEIKVMVNGDVVGTQTITKSLGNAPIMVGSVLCNLHNFTMEQMVQHKEDAVEVGGYFISNGIERVVRLLQVPRSNYITAITRSSFKKRGPEFTEHAVQMRCVNNRCGAQTVTLHYLRDGTVHFKLILRRSEFFIPVILVLKALKGPMSTDREIYRDIVRDDSALSARVELNISQISALKIFTTKDCREYLGKNFRTIMNELSVDQDDEQAGIHFLNKYVFVHINESDEYQKYEVLVQMIRKLFYFVMNKCVADNPDTLNNHDILLPGQVYGAIVRERLENMLFGVKQLIMKDIRVKYHDIKFINGLTSTTYIRSVFDKQEDIGKKLFYFLSTGNLVSETGLDIQQSAGFTVIAEKLNRFRYVSHFRAVHRGQFFTEMRTTAVRKLLPESWGFLCPVHTPDGAPCGLLNHMSMQATVVTRNLENDVKVIDQLVRLLKDFGMQASRAYGGSGPFILSSKSSGDDSLESTIENEVQTIMLDGVIVGYATSKHIQTVIVPALRFYKVKGLNARLTTTEHLPYVNPVELLNKVYNNSWKKVKIRGDNGDEVLEENFVPPHLEVCHINNNNIKNNYKGNYNGLYLFLQKNRFVRPVFNVKYNGLELIGPLSQIYLDIAIKAEEITVETNKYTGEVELSHSHCETFPGAMLSVLASLTPFSDFNQSPRNMYQCQMAKQTMGTPMHNFKHRIDTKLFRINTPQIPICQGDNQANFLFDEHPNGTNLVVAVISYTGYDMEDACILNKAAINRGAKHGTVYKTYVMDFTKEESKFFANFNLSTIRRGQKLRSKKTSDELKNTTAKDDCTFFKSLDFDGLPFIGQRLEYLDPICSVLDIVTGEVKAEKHKTQETGIVEAVKIIGQGTDYIGNLLKKLNYSYDVSIDAITNTDSSVSSNIFLLKLLTGIKRVAVTVRYQRNPIVGDKFASRAGQKGVLSVHWPQEDMPFTESGITPDLIINPHAFPSRMTVGMLLESMAGKAGALHGIYQDSSPFKMQGEEINPETGESETAIDYFGKQLLSEGFSYYGAETMYSGLLGTPLQVDIYIGVVYYQRLRHMVSDKSQVRSVGPIDIVTRQPVKGRKKHGGIRFGEMERDSLLAHGVAYLINDRLMRCSDATVAYLCCGSILSVEVKNDNLHLTNVNEETESESSEKEEDLLGLREQKEADTLVCRLCGRSDQWKCIMIPYVYRYLVNELAAMGIRWSMT